MPDIRQWFIPAEGIERQVISADIQRYLGNDATVRPGQGNAAENNGVPIQGYWIKAYRNLTSAMISDLKQDSVRWRQEQQRTGPKDYAGSTTYNASSAGRPVNARESPSVEGPYGIPGRERMAADRLSAERNLGERMQLDPPSVPSARIQPTAERNFHPEGRAYVPSDRGYPPPENRMPYQQEMPMPSAYGQRPPVTGSYEQPRYAPDYAPNNVPAGYARGAAHIPPVSSPYDPNHGPRPPVTGYAQGNAYAQAPPPSIRPRENGYAQPEYVDHSRYAYPSPATTVSSVARESAAIPAQQPPSAYHNMAPAHHDQYDGRRKFY